MEIQHQFFSLFTDTGRLSLGFETVTIAVEMDELYICTLGHNRACSHSLFVLPPRASMINCI